MRTAFEHAWSATTHKLAYKGDSIGWRRLRLAAQLKASVEQLDLLVAGYDSVAELIDSHGWPEIDVKRRVASVFRNALHESKIPSEQEPASWTRFCDNVYALLRKGFKGRWKDFPAYAKTQLGKVEAEIDRAAGKRFPRSVTLYQFALGTLAPELPAEMRDYYPLVTDSLLDLYPATTRLEQCFRL